MHGLKRYLNQTIRLRVDQRMPYWRHNIRCGLHSGIPWCCVLFFTFVWYPTAETRWHERYRRWRTWWHRNGCIRCPICILRNAPGISAKHCDCYNRKETQS